MSTDDNRFTGASWVRQGLDGDETLRMLVIGSAETKGSDWNVVSAGDGLIFAPFAGLTKELLTMMSPDLVLSTLVGNGFDAFDIAAKLRDFGFEGGYRALTVTLPDPNLIIEEISSIAPDLDFDFFFVD